jgi:uncharacterized protein (TIGR02145 family)
MRLFRFLLILLPAFLLIACNEEPDETENFDPVIISPDSLDAYLDQNLEIIIISGNPEALSLLEIYINNALAAVSEEETLSYVWITDSIIEPCEYQIKAVAHDTEGNARESKMLIRFNFHSPEFSTLDALNILYDSVLVAAQIEDIHKMGEFSLFVCYSPTLPVILENYPNGIHQHDQWKPGDTIEFQLAGLKSNTDYYFCFAYQGGEETVYSETKMFHTHPFYTNQGSFTDERDQREYATVTLNGQTWMAENLAFLPEVYPPDSNGGYWVYEYDGYDTEEAKAAEQYSRTGALYNYETACNVCPSGWHLPSINNWTELETFIGADLSVDPLDFDYSAGVWRLLSPDMNGNNESGLNILAGGWRDPQGMFVFETYAGKNAGFWSTFPYTPRLFNQYGLSRRDADPMTGYSVRCVKDNP